MTVRFGLLSSVRCCLLLMFVELYKVLCMLIYFIVVTCEAVPTAYMYRVGLVFSISCDLVMIVQYSKMVFV